MFLDTNNSVCSLRRSTQRFPRRRYIGRQWYYFANKHPHYAGSLGFSMLPAGKRTFARARHDEGQMSLCFCVGVNPLGPILHPAEIVSSRVSRRF
jgi:hypothetical protein